MSSTPFGAMPLFRYASLLLLPATAALLLIQLNEPLFLLLNGSLAPTFGEPVWVLLTNLGDGFFLFPLAMLLLINHRQTWLPLLLTMLVGAVLLNTGKAILGIARPHGVLGSELVNVIGPALNKHAFPSGHTGTIFLLAGIAMLHLKSHLRTLIVALAIGTAISRIAVGAHWPADVLAGAWVGIVSAILGNAWANKVSKSASTIRPQSLDNLKTRLFFVFLGFVAVFTLPFYDNDFQVFGYLVAFQYLLALVALVMSLSELRLLAKAFLAEHQAQFEPQWLAFKQVAFRFIKFGLVGSSGFVVDLMLYSLLSTLFGIPHLAARGGSYWMTATWNWFWNRKVTFASSNDTPKATQWGKYMAMCLISFVPNWGTYYLLTTFAPYFMEHKQLALIAGVAAGMLFNFTIASLFVFTKRRGALVKEQ